MTAHSSRVTVAIWNWSIVITTGLLAGWVIAGTIAGE